MSKLRVAVVTGAHAFDVVSFHDLFRSFEDCDCYPQTLEDWALDLSRHGDRYAAHVFYNMHTMAPEDAPGGKRTREAIDALGRGPGIVVLHHGILAFVQEPVWDAIVGMTGRTIDGYSHDERLGVQVRDGGHPITRGLADFEILDESYDFRGVDSTDSQVLLGTEHADCMPTLAWTRSYGESRVFNLVLGHDDQAFSHEIFRTVLGRGILWSAQAL